MLESKTFDDNGTVVLSVVDVGAILAALRARPLLAILQEADKALLAKTPVVAHSAMRLAITELKNE